MKNISVGNLDQFIGRTELPEFAKTAKKRILAVQHKDRTKEAICPKCKQKMIWIPGGTSRYIQGGELIEKDYNGYWVCQNKKCWYQSDE